MSQWVNAKVSKPKCEKEVFVVVKHRVLERGEPYYVMTTAIYEDGEMTEEDSRLHWKDMDFDYDEEKDAYIIPKGWWEYRHYTPDDSMISGEVIYWMPLPELPSCIE